MAVRDVCYPTEVAALEQVPRRAPPCAGVKARRPDPKTRILFPWPERFDMNTNQQLPEDCESGGGVHSGVKCAGRNKGAAHTSLAIWPSWRATQQPACFGVAGPGAAGLLPRVRAPPSSASLQRGLRQPNSIAPPLSQATHLFHLGADNSRCHDSAPDAYRPSPFEDRLRKAVAQYWARSKRRRRSRDMGWTMVVAVPSRVANR